MQLNQVFNITVCIIGICILLIHTFNFLLKKNKRKDEYSLGNFLIITIIHFAIYLTFSLIKINYTSDPFVIASYTCFYIFNNLEVFFLFLYMLSYVDLKEKVKKNLSIFNLALLGVFIVLDIVNIFTGIFFTSIGGEYTRSKTMIISQGYQFVMLAVVFIVAIVNKNLLKREKIAFITYCLLPVVAIILQNIFKGYAIAYLSIILATEVLFFFLNVKRNMQLIEEQEKVKEAQISVMMSQIQPHFVYNSLSSISTLIQLDPKEAQRALDNFTEYLRHNISSLTETELIPFEKELKHITTYVELEKIRFEDRIRVKYDIKVRDFFVPPLSIQPIVENAIKHGILKRIEGGSLILRTYQTDSAYVVVVTDDGVGFNIEDVDFDSNEHFGLNNIKTRLKIMCNGQLEIESIPGKGTTVTITFHK